MGVTARKDRPIKRWISCVRPEIRPRDDSRCVRVLVDAGSMEYSEVIQPLPLPRIQFGTPLSMEAVQITRVFPTSMSAEPLAWEMKSGVMRTGRI